MTIPSLRMAQGARKQRERPALLRETKIRVLGMATGLRPFMAAALDANVGD
jgi:hypothetical protein